MPTIKNACLIFLLFVTLNTSAQKSYSELYRNQIHFSPKEKWMNDPNGMVYFDGEYHLFFQYNPDSTVWGPMHWGHAVSTDLFHWEQLPIALYPDSLGAIFSGSVVVDSTNSSGFGKAGEMPMIAVFTQHDEKKASAGASDFQNQSLAYSLDKGRKWTKFTGNPVLRSPGLRDFRDPKVRWLAESKKWIMTLAGGDRILFYSSTDLKSWTKESEFGAQLGAHGGVWECPDLIPFSANGKPVWALLVSVNPGGYQGGSGTQYFTGNFDGRSFTVNDTSTKWLDYGSDNYAGVTWANTGTRKIFLGWMNNWNYAKVTPSSGWRGSMTIPRELTLQLVNGKYFLSMFPVYESHKLDNRTQEYRDVPLAKVITPPSAGKLNGLFRIDMSAETLQAFSFVFTNNKGEQLVAGYDDLMRQFYIDRFKAGKTDFEKSFAMRHSSLRVSKKQILQITLIIDNSSIELFADDGLTCMTDIYFMSQPINRFTMKAADGYKASSFRITTMNSSWPKQ